MAAQPKPVYLGVFANMDFPDYKYEHYPLMMTKVEEDKKVSERIVNDAIEQELAEKEGFSPPKKVGPPVTLTTTEVRELQKIAAESSELAEAAKKVALERDARVQELEAQLAKLMGKQADGSPKPKDEPKNEPKA